MCDMLIKIYSPVVRAQQWASTISQMHTCTHAHTHTRIHTMYRSNTHKHTHVTHMSSVPRVSGHLLQSLKVCGESILMLLLTRQWTLVAATPVNSGGTRWTSPNSSLPPTSWRSSQRTSSILLHWLCWMWAVIWVDLWFFRCPYCVWPCVHACMHAAYVMQYRGNIHM